MLPLYRPFNPTEKVTYMCTNQDWVIFGNSCGVVNFCGQIKSTPTHTANLSSRGNSLINKTKPRNVFLALTLLPFISYYLLQLKKKWKKELFKDSFGLFWEAVELWHTAGCGFIATDFLS